MVLTAILFLTHIESSVKSMCMPSFLMRRYLIKAGKREIFKSVVIYEL